MAKIRFYDTFERKEIEVEGNILSRDSNFLTIQVKGKTISIPLSKINLIEEGEGV